MQINATNNNLYNFKAKTLTAVSTKNIQNSINKVPEAVKSFNILKSVNVNPKNIDKFNTKDIGMYLMFRSNSLPTSISPIFQVTGNFLCGKTNVDMYKKVVENLDKKLQDRLLHGESSEVFKRSYNSELKFIEEIKKVNNSFSEKKIDKKEFDSIIEKLTKDYLVSPRNREKIFMY